MNTVWIKPSADPLSPLPPPIRLLRPRCLLLRDWLALPAPSLQRDDRQWKSRTRRRRRPGWGFVVMEGQHVARDVTERLWSGAHIPHQTQYIGYTCTNAYRCVQEAKLHASTHGFTHTHTPDRYRARFVPDKLRPLCLTRSSTSLSLHQRTIEEGWEKRQRASLPRSLASKPNKEPQIAKPLGCLSACRWRPNIIVSTSPFSGTDWGIGQLGSALS